MIEAERQAQFHFWREIGSRMAIRGIPESLAELEALNAEVERTRFAPTEAGRRVARSQLDVFLDWFPWLPKRLGARAISALLEENVVHVLGLARPSSAERRASEAALRLRGRALRLLPSRRRPKLRTPLQRRSYPAGYELEELGPPPASAVR
jgi:hypothetical protein